MLVLIREERFGMKDTPPDDGYQIRCPRLGHQIHFGYCRVENQGLPCFKVLDCWHAHFLVADCLRRELTEEQWANLLNQKSKSKMLSLVELIEQAKNKKKEAGS